MRQYFSLKGRSSRLEWWVIDLAVMLGFYLNNQLFGLLGGGAALFQKPGQLWFLVAMLLCWLSFASIVRRLHDRGKSAWWSLPYLIPGLGQVWCIVECGFLEGRPGVNRHGPPPAALDPRRTLASIAAWLQGAGPAKTVQAPARSSSQRARLTPSRASAVTRVEPRRSRKGIAVMVGIALVLGGLVTLAMTVGIPIPVAFVTAGDKFPGEDTGGPGFAPIDKALKP